MLVSIKKIADQVEKSQLVKIVRINRKTEKFQGEKEMTGKIKVGAEVIATVHKKKKGLRVGKRKSRMQQRTMTHRARIGKRMGKREEQRKTPTRETEKRT